MARRWLAAALAASGFWFATPQAGAITTNALLQMQLGNPSNASADTNNHDHFLIQRTVEALDYSDHLGQPNWASWDLTSEDANSAVGRSPDFFTDTNLPPNFFRVPGDPINPFTGSGYDRGHMCPSADRTDSRADNDMVFFMSNVIPQKSEQNQGVWATFEDRCRTNADGGNELLIICGPSLFTTNKLYSNHVTIPGYTWKIVVVVRTNNNGSTAASRITPSTRVIAVRIPNTAGVSSEPMNYVTNTVAIESDTGFTFFTALAPNLATVLRNKIDGQTPPAPMITGFSPTSGSGNASVIITGTNFVFATNVTFNGTSAAFNIDSTTQITAIVPTNATSGPVGVASLGGSATTSSNFNVTVASDLAVLASHAGNFAQGDTSDTYTIIVTNVGAGSTFGTITVTDALPASLTATAIGGTGWTASLGTLTCTRSDILAAGASYPPITLTVNVAASAPGSVTNIASVSGGGDTNLINNTASDPTTINPLLSLASIQTVFVIVMENHDWSQIIGSSSAPYINNMLLPIASHAEQYYNPPAIHPSLPNYLWLEAGTNFGILDDENPSIRHQDTTNHLVSLLGRAGVSWTSYQEDISGGVCPLTSVNLYTPRHNPMVYFDDVTNTNNNNSAYCVANVRPYSELASDLQSNMVTRYNFITPNACNDMHDNAGCATPDPILNGDNWLSNNLPAILNSQAYANNGAVFIVWDEAGSVDGPIGMILLSPLARGGGYSNTIHYTHSSTLRTMEEIFNVSPLLGDAANATDLADLFNFSVELPPAVITGTATEVATNTASLNGTVNPNGRSTSVHFDYGLTTAYGSNAAVAGTLSGSTAQAVNANLTGLSPGTTYHFRVSAGNSVGTNNGLDQTFTTAASIVDLAVSKTHIGNFTRGDTGDSYTIIVTNMGSQASGGMITVTDSLPAGLTATAISGSGWTTNLSTLVCTRSDALAANAAYPPITVIVNVSSNAPASVTNTAIVSGGGDANSANNTANDATIINGSGGGGGTNILAGWDTSALPGGSGNFGPSPFGPTTIAPNLASAGLIRGSGVGLAGTAALRAWGGTSFTNTTSAAAIVANQFTTFSISASNGYTVSVASISKFDYRHSGTGATNGLLQYQIGSGAFTDVAVFFYPSNTSSGGTLTPIDLSGISALQNVGSGTNVTFRIVNWGGTSSAGTWYIFDVANSTAADFVLQGTVTALTPIQSWRLQWFGTTANGGAAADTAITTSDGMPNLLKYALGLNPFVATNNPVIGDITTGYLRLTLPKNPNATDVSFHVEVTADLMTSSWTSIGTTIDQNTSTLLQVHVNTPVSASARDFMRLRVSRP